MRGNELTDRRRIMLDKLINSYNEIMNKPVLILASLPPAGEGYRGKIVITTDTEQDKAYVCLKKSDNTYAWFDMLTFRLGY